MGDRVFATEILGAAVRADNGAVLGVLDDIIVDLTSGEIAFLLIKDPSAACKAYKTDPEGRKMVPVKNIDMKDDHVVVSL